MQEEKINKRLVYRTFLQREEGRYHHTYNEELLQYEYVREGDMRSIDESKRLFRTGIAGKLADDPLTDKKYLFVAATTLATRFCIEGGLDEQEAYNISDLYIQGLKECPTVDSVNERHTEMIRTFTERMSELRKNHRPESEAPDNENLPVIQKSMDYIYYHLHEKIRIEDIGAEVGMSPNYLSSLFKKTTGMTVQEYVRSRRVEAARNMLIYSDFTPSEIGEILTFSSQSHFIRVFKAETGVTPNEYRKRNFRLHARWNGKYGNTTS